MAHNGDTLQTKKKPDKIKRNHANVKETMQTKKKHANKKETIQINNKTRK